MDAAERLRDRADLRFLLRRRRRRQGARCERRARERAASPHVEFQPSEPPERLVATDPRGRRVRRDHARARVLRRDHPGQAVRLPRLRPPGGGGGDAATRRRWSRRSGGGAGGASPGTARRWRSAIERSRATRSARRALGRGGAGLRRARLLAARRRRAARGGADRGRTAQRTGVRSRRCRAGVYASLRARPTSRCARRCCSCSSPLLLVHRARDPARLARAGALPPAAHRARLVGVHDPQVPHHAGRAPRTSPRT